jgi:pyruvate,water dikinase
MELTRAFSELNANDAPIAGGKGASLGEMFQAGIPVPPGYVILSAAFERFLSESVLAQEIDSVLRTVKHTEMQMVEDASEKIKSLILDAAMPEDIKADIQKHFKILDSKFVAVRSSATAEDGAEHAWAGQLESYLNTTEEHLLINVQRCWASLFTPRAIFYRFEKGLHNTDISVAVVVQTMVESDVSGIAFSVHPVSENRNQIIIEAGFGLGEAIVSGEITPDSYVVEKEPQRIAGITVAEQTKAIHKKEGGGNGWRPIAYYKQNQQKLSDEEILLLADIILKVEQHYGFPCDIEWAKRGKDFYIVQSRPITTLTK